LLSFNEGRAEGECVGPTSLAMLGERGREEVASIVPESLFKTG
jgi:hypothetical protein